MKQSQRNLILITLMALFLLPSLSWASYRAHCLNEEGQFKRCRLDVREDHLIVSYVFGLVEEIPGYLIKQIKYDTAPTDNQPLYVEVPLKMKESKKDRLGDPSAFLSLSGKNEEKVSIQIFYASSVGKDKGLYIKMSAEKAKAFYFQLQTITDLSSKKE